MEVVLSCSTRTLHPDIKVTSISLRYQRWAATCRERWTIRMGSTSRHLTCTTAVMQQRQIFLYCDVVTHLTTSLPRSVVSEKKLLFTFRTVMLEEHVDLVSGDFNGAAWRRSCGSDRRLTSIVEEAFADTKLLAPPGPSTTVRSPSPTARWVSKKKIKVANTKCGCILLMLTLAAQYKHARHVHLKERASPYDHSTPRRAHRDQSDHSRDT